MEGFRDEADADALDFVLGRRVALQDGALGFDGDCDGGGVALLEEAGDAGECAAGADAGDEAVDAPLQLFPDFGGGCVVMVVGVGLVLELEGDEGVGDGCGGGAGSLDGAGHAFSLRGAVHGCAEAAHEDAFLFGEALGDEEQDLVAAVDADKGESDAGVPGGRLNDCRTRAKQAACLGVEDDAEGGAVFDAAAGVEELELGEEGGGGRWGDAAEAEHGRGADEFGDVAGHAELRAGVGWRRHQGFSLSHWGRGRLGGRCCALLVDL